ncbi:N-acyl homoserine lactonase family protein [Phenylobacterium soli]|uniref:N-acyl homoserine lactonase family protein n=1 Tax=Phenylobacterium soli TaxID=2170551 RepID=A0A328AIV3_9CAUL|nr:N-acyl homoserine lactonase family protein [Phenylobacterium soli]RAK54762.1 N-acyl homoserine lactonase family protein [Phenylobacterium soli]
MTLRLFGCVCGQFHGSAEGMGMAGTGPVSVPVPFYVLEHPDGVALFDCGLPAGMVDYDDSYRQALRATDIDASLTPEETATRHLERLDIDPARVRQVVVSHLHFDHVGGLREFPNAEVVIQRREWEAGFDRETAGHYGLRKRFFDLGHAVRLVDGEHDLFGDGSAVCLPSYGHTPGHQSLRVRSAQGDHILVADACYNCRVAETRSFPDYSDAEAMNRSLDALLALREAATVMVYGHDPDQWGERPVLPAARS